MRKSVALLSIALIFTISCKKQNHLTVSTVAGSGLMGSADGNATEASFSNPMGLCLDEKGNIYVADSRNNKIRKVGPDGEVTTIAGSGAVGSADGKGAVASFFSPVAVAVGKRGNVYVADTHNSLVRKINGEGVVTTFAGRLPVGTDPKKPIRPVFDNPMSIITDAAGNVYIADWIHDKVRKITQDGKITTIAGTGDPGAKDGPCMSATFYLPEGIAADKRGNLYVSDTYNNMIRKISKDGVVTTLAGKLKKGNANGKGPAASFSHPAGIAVDKNGTVYVADSGNNLIRMINPQGIVTTYAGTGERGRQDGSAETATFYRPVGVAVDTGGNVYVADYENNLVRKISRY